jgi:hypothetical protein
MRLACLSALLGAVLAVPIVGAGGARRGLHQRHPWASARTTRARDHAEDFRARRPAPLPRLRIRPAAIAFDLVIAGDFLNL